MRHSDETTHAESIRVHTRAPQAHHDVVATRASNARFFNAKRFAQVRTSSHLYYSFRRRPLSCDLLSLANHESYTRRRCEGPMEGRSIIHKMHVLERSFLPKLKYSTSHSYHPLLHPGPIPGGVSLREFHRASPPWCRHQPRRCRPPSTADPAFHAHSSPGSQRFLRLVDANLHSLRAGRLVRSTDKIFC